MRWAWSAATCTRRCARWGYADVRQNLDASLPPEPDDLGELTHDAIAGSFRITQRKHGHRYSIDDVITAAIAADARPGALRCLELGSGIGSVLLMLCYRLPQAQFVAIEAQRNSFELLSRNVAHNRLGERVQALHGDLRELVTPALGQFELITGTPPYVPPGRATPSTDAQRAYARQELRGGVEDYVFAAQRVVSPDGLIVVCADARFPQRVEQAALQCNLTIVAQCDVFPRAERPALFSVFSLSPRERVSQRVSNAFVARTENGARTEQYLALREAFGMPRPSRETPSP
jgi:tRNA1(Val) A37 N6-methylase TrmN6